MGTLAIVAIDLGKDVFACLTRLVPCRSDACWRVISRPITAGLIASNQIGISCLAHIVASPKRIGQQGRLQRRSLFLVLALVHEL